MPPRSHTPSATVAPQVLDKDYTTPERIDLTHQSSYQPGNSWDAQPQHERLMTDADAQSLLNFPANDEHAFDPTLWIPTSADLAGFATELPMVMPNEGNDQNEGSSSGLHRELQIQREEHSRVCNELEKAMAEIRKLSAKLDKLLSMTEDLSMWSGALNPLVSMLLERMGGATGDPVLSEKIESWLDLAE